MQDSEARLVLISAADIPTPPLCCQQAHEQGYRRGYRDGYWYALWDLGKLVRISDTLWAQLEAFMYDTVKHWVWRASHQPEGRVAREFGPRFHRPKRQRPQTAPNARS
jgi:hypothetical protein